MIYSGQEDIEVLQAMTEPVDHLIICDITLDTQLFEPLLNYFRIQGKFLRNVFFKHVKVDLEMLVKLLNLLKNCLNLHLYVTITNCLEDTDPVRNHFRNLKTLKLIFKDSDYIPDKVFDEFFSDSEEITKMVLSNNFNLIFNKPKMKKLFLIFDGDYFVEVNSPNNLNRVYENLTEFGVEFGQKLVTFSDRELNIFEKFILKQSKIEKLKFVNMCKLNSHTFQIISRHFSKLLFLQSVEIYDNSENKKGVREDEKIKITDYLIDNPLLKSFSLHCQGLDLNFQDISIINQFQFVENLSIRCNNPGILLQLSLPNLRKLDLSCVESLTYDEFQVVIETFIENSENISELSLEFVMNKKLEDCESISQYNCVEFILKNLKKLTIFSFNPRFYIMSDVTVDLLRIFLEDYVKLKKLTFQKNFDNDHYIFDFQNIMNYYETHKPSMTFEYDLQDQNEYPVFGDINHTKHKNYPEWSCYFDKFSF